MPRLYRVKRNTGMQTHALVMCVAVFLPLLVDMRALIWVCMPACSYGSGWFECVCLFPVFCPSKASWRRSSRTFLACATSFWRTNPRPQRSSRRSFKNLVKKWIIIISPWDSECLPNRQDAVDHHPTDETISSVSGMQIQFYCGLSTTTASRACRCVKRQHDN